MVCEISQTNLERICPRRKNNSGICLCFVYGSNVRYSIMSVIQTCSAGPKSGQVSHFLFHDHPLRSLMTVIGIPNLSENCCLQICSQIDNLFTLCNVKLEISIHAHRATNSPRFCGKLPENKPIFPC